MSRRERLQRKIAQREEEQNIGKSHKRVWVAPHNEAKQNSPR